MGLPLVHDGGHLGGVQICIARTQSDGTGQREARCLGEAPGRVGWDSDDAQEGGGVEEGLGCLSFVVDRLGRLVCLCS